MEESIFAREQIDITPDTSLFPKIGRSGYTLTQSIAELIDNSIDARIMGKLLEINIYMHDSRIIISDNARGMNKEEAAKAMKLGFSEKKEALGEFGLGLKSACTSLGNFFMLKTYPLGLKVGYKYEYNEKDWSIKRSRSNWTDELQLFEKGIKKHGTEVRIGELKRRFSKQRSKEVLDDFSKRYAPFIKSGDVKICVNQKECIPEEPVLIDEGKTPFEITDSKGNKISGWYGLMKKGSDRGHYGFSTYRRGRMITWYDKIGIPTHPAVSRIVGEINLDYVPVSHNKKEFEVESEEYEEASNLLKEKFEDLVKKAKQASTSSKATKEVKNATDNWKESIVKAFHKDIKPLVELGNTNRKRSNDKDDPVGRMIIEKRNSPLHRQIQKIIEKNERSRKPRDKKQIVISHFIKIKGKDFNIEHDYASLGENSGWMQYDFIEQKGSIVILTNEDFPAFSATNDIPFYAAIHISEAIAEIVTKVGGYNYEQKDEFKQKMLKRASEYMVDFG